MRHFIYAFILVSLLLLIVMPMNKLFSYDGSLKKVEIETIYNFKELYTINSFDDLKSVPKDFYFVTIYVEIEALYRSAYPTEHLYYDYMNNYYYDNKNKMKLIKKITCGKAYWNIIENKVKECVK